MFAECFVVKEIWIEIKRWILEVFKLQTASDRYSTLFEKYENSRIHRLENLIILFTNRYILQRPKMRPSYM